MVSKDFIFKKGPFLYLAKNEEIYGIVSYQKFFMSSYITFKNKWVIAMWVTSGLSYGSVGQMGQQVQPTFNPGGYYKCRLKYLDPIVIIIGASSE